MERLILLLLSPAIFAERPKVRDPNSEPFLPIHPVYPYSPKLIKRGAEQESISQLTPESYAPKADAKDTYSPGNENNDQRDPYYANYNPYAKGTSPSPTYPPAYYNEDPYAYGNSPYAAYGSYPAPYAVSPAPYPASSYPEYYYQPQYYYPHYFNPELFSQVPSPQPPAPAAVDYHETSQDSAGTEESDKQNTDKTDKKSKVDETSQDAPTGHFVDGGNYISASTRDLDGQSSTYKTANPYNQVEQDHVQVKNLPIALPKTTYRVISVGGQPVGPDYPLPATYVKVQQMEQLSQTLNKPLVPNARESQSHARDTTDSTSGSYVTPSVYDPGALSYVTVPGVATKTAAVSYALINPGVAKINEEHTSPSLPHTTSSKNAKYSNVLYVRKPATQATLEYPQVTYVPSGNRGKQPRVLDRQPTDQIDEYGYEAPPSYDGTYNQPENKQKQNYAGYQQRQPDAYRGKDYVAAPQKPRSYTYQYSAYEADQGTAQQQQPQQDKVNVENVNYGTKQYTNKG